MDPGKVMLPLEKLGQKMELSLFLLQLGQLDINGAFVGSTRITRATGSTSGSK